MARPPSEITDAELAVLQVLWELQSATIRQLTQRLYPGGSPSQYATVQKLLERLEGKTFVRRDRGAAVHQFQACVCREELIGRRLRTVAEKLCGGSLTPLLTHLVTHEKLSTRERQELRDLINRLEKGSHKTSRRRKQN